MEPTASVGRQTSLRPTPPTSDRDGSQSSLSWGREVWAAVKNLIRVCSGPGRTARRQKATIGKPLATPERIGQVAEAAGDL
jgi:hypothetical protein